MSKIFYDHIVSLGDVEKEIKSIAPTHGERAELWQIVDEIVHHKTLGCIFDHLPHEHHEEFLVKFHEAPHDESLLGYLKEKIGENIEEIIKQELGGLTYELLSVIRGES